MRKERHIFLLPNLKDKEIMNAIKVYTNLIIISSLVNLSKEKKKKRKERKVKKEKKGSKSWLTNLKTKTFEKIYMKL